VTATLLAETVRLAGGRMRESLTDRLIALEPTRLEKELSQVLPGRVAVRGTFERRLLFAERQDAGDWLVAELSGRPLLTRVWPAWARGRLTVEEPGGWLSPATLSSDGVRRLLRPRVLLASLYHPEWFPLPRFPLAISDVARAARATLTGQVQLLDMQLGMSLPDILAIVARDRPDVVGVSATFGQHDLMLQLLDHLASADQEGQLVVAGGSLTVRNESLLLARYPRLVIARGTGEPTIEDLLAYWHGDVGLPQVRSIGYTEAHFTGVGVPTSVGQPSDGTASPGDLRRTGRPASPGRSEAVPELDLLAATFAHRGVAQLETSRGCTSSCSFCPRGHKGSWSALDPAMLPGVLAAMRGVFDAHPDISRTLYLVDEEFIGNGPTATARAVEVAETIHRAGLRWESSCRVDQIADPGADRGWHIERAALFRHLRRAGLRRMLFGVESGVDSVLDRFAKQTTADQNALAIRTLSALGVPTRFTYITFDPLMSAAELRATYEFQARTDLLLRPLPDLPVVQIVDGVRDEAFVAAHATGRGLYTGISYMLVSMECLVGSAYTRRVQAAGLAGLPRPSLGRLDARFADWRIGRASHHAQLWIDRHFPLDYTLKSLEKTLPDEARHRVRQARVVLKDAAHALLGRMLDLIDTYPAPDYAAAPTPVDPLRERAFDAALVDLLDDALAAVGERVDALADSLAAELPAEGAAVLNDQVRRWRTTREWALINAAETCGALS
jgi:B12 binding domain